MTAKLNTDKAIRQSFDEVFQLYYPRLCDFAARMLQSNAPEVEDVVQDAFLVFHQNMGQLSPHPEVLKKYLYTTVKYSCLKMHRHNRVVEKYQKHINAAELTDDFTLEAIIHAEIIGEIHRTLATLPSGCAEVFRLGYFDELSNQEIADRLNISINTVKSQKKRALDLLRSKLSPEAFAFLGLFLIR